MDAISFVLGIKSSHLRSSHLRDLIYRGRVLKTSKIQADGTATEAVETGHEANGNGAHAENGEEEDDGDTQTRTASQRTDPTSAWVMAVYLDDAGEEQKWKRSITSSGQSEYRINNRSVSAKAYNGALEAENILIRARNFLVFQGDVEAIASQSPRDLTRLIEQISGSIEFQKDYETLEAEMNTALEEQQYRMTQRRAVGGEVRQYQEQKKEAEAWERKRQERDTAVVTHSLWKLYRFQQAIDSRNEEIRKHQEELKEFKRGVEKFETRLEDARRAQANVTKNVAKVERTIKTKEREVEEKANSLVPIDEKIHISRRNLEKYQMRVAEVEKEREAQSKHIEQLKKDLSTVQKAQTRWEEDFRAQSQSTGRQLSENHLQEYTRLRGEVSKRTSGDQGRVDMLARQIRTDEETANSLRSTVETCKAQIAKLDSEITELKERRKDRDSQVKSTQKEIDGKKKEYNALTSERLRYAQKQTELEEKLQQCLQRLLEADSGRRESEKELRAKETVAQMKRIFPGVKGRVHELCRPKQKKFETAVSTVLGRHFEAIVTDTEKTAKDCIAYLRDQRLGQGTFIPLDTIQVKAVNSNLKGLHPGMRLAIDTIEYDNSVERAMSYACGNSIVCDTLQIARELVFNRNLEVKAVSLDGTIIHKGGLMTGGRGPQDRNAKRWEDSEVENLKRVRDGLMAELSALPRGHRRGMEEEQLQGELAGLEQRLKYLTEEATSLGRNIDSKSAELRNARTVLGDAEPKLRNQESGLATLRANFERHRTSVATVEDTVFADFCRRTGYENIRSYEQQQGTLQQEAAQKKLEFTTQRSRLENQLAFETQRLDATRTRISGLQTHAKRDENLIAELEREKDKIQTQIDTLQAEMEQLEEQVDKYRKMSDERAAAVASARAELAKRSKNVEGTLKTVAGLEAEVQREAANRYALLRKCKIDEITIPLAAGSAKLDKLPLDDLLQTDPDAMDVEEDTATAGVQGVRDYGIFPDFDLLDDDVKDDTSDKRDELLQEQISSLTHELEKMNPNMRAVERLDAVEVKAREADKDYDNARKTATRASKAFEDVKQERLELFNKAFNHISDAIGGVYRELTRSAQSPMGGQAHLDLEDEDLPFSSGIKYTAMPPLKRFRDMEHLSGGEKTMAALALLFAIHSFQPSPFFVLDEVDAALDNVNVSRVAQYLKTHAGPVGGEGKKRREGGMQFIVISLKTGLFQESETLVGIMRDQTLNTSRALTLDVSLSPPVHVNQIEAN